MKQTNILKVSWRNKSVWVCGRWARQSIARRFVIRSKTDSTDREGALIVEILMLMLLLGRGCGRATHCKRLKMINNIRVGLCRLQNDRRPVSR